MPSLEIADFYVVCRFFAAGTHGKKKGSELKARPKGAKTAFVDPRTGHVILKDKDETILKRWERAVQAAAEATQDPFGGGPLPRDEWDIRLDLVFQIHRPKSHYRTGRFERELKPGHRLRPGGHNTGDLDKLERAVLDALEGTIYEEDCQVVGEVSEKVYVDRFDGEPGVAVTVFAAPAAALKHASVASG